MFCVPGQGVSCDNLILLCMLLLGCTVVVVQTSCSIIDLLMDMKSHFFSRLAREILLLLLDK